MHDLGGAHTVEFVRRRGIDRWVPCATDLPAGCEPHASSAPHAPCSLSVTRREPMVKSLPNHAALPWFCAFAGRGAVPAAGRAVGHQVQATSSGRRAVWAGPREPGADGPVPSGGQPHEGSAKATGISAASPRQRLAKLEITRLPSARAAVSIRALCQPAGPPAWPFRGPLSTSRPSRSTTPRPFTSLASEVSPVMPVGCHRLPTCRRCKTAHGCEWRRSTCGP
jgi:hypothetical protein